MGQLTGTPQTVTLPALGEECKKIAYGDFSDWTGDYTTVAPATMTPDLAELIGYFMGDGSFHTKGPQFCVANTDADVAERVKGLLKSLFNLNAHVIEQQGYCEVSAHSVPLTLWWDACGFRKHAPSETHSGKGYLPHVPDAVLATNDPAVYGAFLRGLYEADGTVTAGNPTWTTVCREFSEEVKTLMLALGLPTATRHGVTGWGNSTAYILRLRNAGYAARFREAVGFMGARKAGKVSQSTGEQTERHDYVFLGESVINELVPATHPLRSAANLALKRHGAITRRTAQALLAETGDARIAHALRFFYDRIASNEDGGVCDTYDLSVPENVTYIAQGFVSHNTIGFMMDCDTTGVEPDIAIVKFKSLVGGGFFKIVNQTVPEALERLGYSAGERKAILDYIEEQDTIEGAPGLSDEHLSVFDCAFRAKNGVRSIHYMGHIKMMSAVQPFISGAISKCITGETLVFSEEQGIFPIGALYAGEKPGEFRAYPLTLGSVGEPQAADLFYYGGVRPTVKLALADGRTLEGTPNHRVKVANATGYDWKQLADITETDYVAVRLGAEVWARQNADLRGFKPSALYGSQKAIRVPERMTESLARFLGSYIAEGNKATSNWTVRVTNNDPHVLQVCLDAVQEAFGLSGKVETDKRNGVTSAVWAAKTLVEWLDFVGAGGDSATKRVPWAVMQSRRESVQAFVGGLWLDGYVRGSDGMTAICLNSPELLKELQIVLNNFGLRPRIITKQNAVYNKSYNELGLHGADVKRFAELFRLDEAPKAARLAVAAAKMKKVNAVHSDVVPCYRDLAQAAVYAAHETMAWRHVFDKRTGNLSWETARALYERFGITQLGEIVENNIHFVPVRTITEGMATVYDFQVPANHAFLGNAVVNHNTVNMPHDATPGDIAEAYLEAWKLGTKALAIYRDGSKKTQPLSTGATNEAPAKATEQVVEFKPLRRKLPDERASLTHKFSVGGHEGYITIGTYPDGQVGEIFVTMSKEGSVVSGLMDSFATAISLSLQYGVPLKTLVDKFMHTRFEPSGFTGNPDIPMAKSIMDYLFRYLALKFLDKDERANVGLIADEEDDYPEVPPTKAVASASPIKLATAKLVRGATESAGQPGQRGRHRRTGSGNGKPGGRGRAAGIRDAGGRAAVSRMWLDHDAQRGLLPVRELRDEYWLLVS